ncbi:MAG TPA: ABC transporter substrate-binding protein, partial [Hyphomicrobiaceae bacterium]|nr:ABC transporter substrate-binding protein [Hyphomicrobiaceae bacterium]
AIKSKVMRGMAVPSALLISPLLYSRSAEFKRHPYDPEAAKKLLAEAGYPNGFEVTLDCPNDRYVNDEAICRAVAQMLARINVRIRLNSMPKARYFEKAGPTRKYDSSFNLIGWTASSLDGWNILHNVAGCRDAEGKGAQFNFGGYCNPEVDALADKILTEVDLAKRDDLLTQAFRIIHADVGLIPLHQQALAWGVRRNIPIAQRADGRIFLYWVRKD